MPSPVPTPAPVPAAYFSASRSPRYSLLFALPLLAAYEALAAVVAPATGSRPALRNGADVLLRELSTALVGPSGPMALMGVIIVVSLALVVRDRRRNGGGLRVWIFGAMLAESAALAAAFGVVVGIATARLLGSLNLMMVAQSPSPIDQASWGTRLMLSLGAGLWEELLFRVLLVGSLATAARIALGLGRRGSGLLATLAGALIFAAFHYIGPYGDRFTIESFTFRAIGGVAFGAIYVTRGFGITAWTHALYDAALLL